MSTPRRIPYCYSVLRYVHDIATGEFVNVGVVLFAKRESFVSARFKTAFTRVKCAFPTLDAQVFKSRMKRLQRIFDKIAQRDFDSPGFQNHDSIESLLHTVIPLDDSSLQWSDPGSGISNDLNAAFESLYARFVTKYDLARSTRRKDDEDVWKQFRHELEKRNVIAHLEEKVIEVVDDSVRFEHAWKNGTWHCYEPVSFDLSNDSSIREKAIRWLGQMSSIKEATEDFKVYFLVGKPEDARLHKAYEKAVSILNKAPSSTVVEEASAKEFSESVAREILEHAGH